MAPDIMRSPYTWGADGLTVDANNGGATGFLASAHLDDLTLDVEFTPRLINPGKPNVVAYVGGPISNTIAGITVLIDGTNDNAYITAIITGTNKSVVKLNSGIKRTS